MGAALGAEAVNGELWIEWPQPQNDASLFEQLDERPIGIANRFYQSEYLHSSRNSWLSAENRLPVLSQEI